MALNGITRNITGEQMTADEFNRSEVQQSEAAALIERLLDGAAQGILVATRAGIIERANPALEAMFGYARGELAGQALDRLIPQGVRAQHAHQHLAFWTAPRSRPMGQNLDLAGQRKDGTTLPVEVSLTYVATADGGRAVAFVSDITRRRQAEEELRHHHTQLQHRSDQLRRLTLDLTVAEQEARESLAKTVHDGLQQMLFSVKLRLDRMARARRRGGRASDELDAVRHDLDQAIEAARSLAVELYPPPLLDGRLRPAMAWLAAWMREKYGLRVAISADRRATLDEPNQKSHRALVFDSVRELLFNVVKHAKVTQATVDLSIVDSNHLRVTVADEGAGFDTAALGRPAAMGWGLFRIRERAEILGGSLQVESAPGHGTRFLLTIPRGHARASRQALRILIAEDNDMARASLRETLTQYPEFDIVGEAATGADAVSHAKSLRPDAIVMDISMPEMNGVEATRHIVGALPATHIFGFSTQDRPEGGHVIEEAGAVAYLCKNDGAQRLVDRLLALHAERCTSQ